MVPMQGQGKGEGTYTGRDTSSRPGALVSFRPLKVAHHGHFEKQFDIATTSCRPDVGSPSGDALGVQPPYNGQWACLHRQALVILTPLSPTTLVNTANPARQEVPGLCSWHDM